MAPKVQSASASAILGLRKQIKGLVNEEGAEALFELIENDSAVSAADKQRLHVELQTRVNEVQQEEIDKKVAAKDQAGADKILNRTEEEQKDEKGKKLPSARKPLRAAEEIAEEEAARDSQPAHVPEGCKAVEMTVEKAQEYELKDMTLPSKDRKLMGMKPITDGRRDTPITKFLVIVKIALFLACILVPSQSFAALASDDIAVLTDFTQTKGVKVDASGDLVPVTTATNSLGDADLKFTDAYLTGDVTFRSTLISSGRYGNAVLRMESSSTPIGAAQLAYAVINKRIGGAGGLDNQGWGTRLANGTPGQTITFTTDFVQTNGSWVITPVTTTGFTKVTLDAVAEFVTMTYISDTVGWVLTGTNATVA
jgi:hypothetical protein